MKKTLELKVKANSGRSEIIEKDGRIIVYVKSVAENNKANLEVLKLFSKKYKNARILKGLKSSKKLLSVEI